jgi:flagellar FliL protein
MADKKPDAAKPEGADKKPDASAAPAAAPAAGGKAAWLPLAITVLTMPVLAYAMTAFVLVPKMQKALGAAPPAEAEVGKPAGEHGEAAKPAEKDDGHGKAGATSGKAKYAVPLSKMVVNVAGTAGTRYLMTSVTLVGANPDFKSTVEDNRDHLLDLATGALSGKTIADLEKPGARNQIRSELLSMFNTALGENAVKEIYITELAIQ